jgi:hypothetical protein
MELCRLRCYAEDRLLANLEAVRLSSPDTSLGTGGLIRCVRAGRYKALVADGSSETRVWRSRFDQSDLRCALRSADRPARYHAAFLVGACSRQERPC